MRNAFMKAIRIFTAMVLAALLTVGAVGCTPAASAPAATVHNAFSYKNDEYYDPTINN